MNATQEAKFTMHRTIKQTPDTKTAIAATVAAREDYGINQDKLTESDNAIKDYAAKTPNPRATVANRCAQKANLQEHFRQGDSILKKQIDKLVKNFRTKRPDFTIHISTFAKSPPRRPPPLD